jgi:uncharacterized paraquat-inducible protein A
MNAAASLPRRNPLIGGLLVVSLLLNIASLCLPFVMIDEAGSAPLIYGLIGSARMLFDAGMVALAMLVVGFSIVFPFAKLGVLLWLWRTGVHTARRVAWLERVEKLGKWSFFDVFLIAIMVGITNDQWLISSASLPGLTFFMAALLVGMLAGELLVATSPAHHRPAQAVRPPPSLALLILLLVIAALYAATLFVPFVQIDDWRLADHEFSLVGLVPALRQNDSPELAVSILAFLVVTPSLGLLTAFVMTIFWWRRSPPRALIVTQRLIRRWSMLPVFALSLAVFRAEGHHFLGTEPRPGMWMLVTALSLTIVGQFTVARAWRHC